MGFGVLSGIFSPEWYTKKSYLTPALDNTHCLRIRSESKSTISESLTAVLESEMSASDPETAVSNSETLPFESQTVGSVPFVLVPALVLTWHHVKIVTGRTIVGGARVISGAEKKII